MVKLITQLWIGMYLLTLCCSDNTGNVLQKIGDLDDETRDIKSKIPSDIELAQASLRLEFKQQLQGKVRKAITEILQGESLVKMVRSQMVSEVRKLKHGHHQMKRQLRHVMKTLRNVLEERNNFNRTLLKNGMNLSEVKTCPQYITDKGVLQRQLKLCRNELGDCHVDVEQLAKGENDLVKLFARWVIMSQDRNNKTAFLGRDIHQEMATVIGSRSMTSKSPIVISQLDDVRNRIIVAPYSSWVQQQFRQLSISTNSITNYHYLNFKNVQASAYMAKERKLLLAISRPDRIISSNLDGYDVQTVRKQVTAFAMAVDEEIGLIFFTFFDWFIPPSIKCMTKTGKRLTTVLDLHSYCFPGSIAVQSKEKKIYYICNYDTVRTVTYDGVVLVEEMLAKGQSIHTLSFDSARGNLYYNDNRNLIQISLAQNVSTVVTRLDVIPIDLKYYNNSLYYSSYNEVATRSSILGKVDILNGSVTIIETVKMKRINGLLLCLVP